MPSVNLTCLQCGTIFSANKRDAREGRKFCGHACYRAYEATHGRPREVELVHFSCKQCGKDFTRQPGELRQYRKVFGKDPLYCSRDCSNLGRRLSEDKWQVHCIQCGKLMPIQRRPGGTLNRDKKLCSTACRSKFRQERAPNRYEGGAIPPAHEKRHGYMWLSIPAYMSPTGKKKEILEHRYRMEQKLGRSLLPGETVHHIDGDRKNNKLENLELFSSRHGPGQRVVDKIQWAIELLLAYPDFTERAGYKLSPLEDHAALTYASGSRTNSSSSASM